MSPRTLGLALLLLLTCLAVPLARADQAAIVLDGAFEDWNGIAPVYTDATGDGGGSGIDFGRLWLAEDNEYFYIRVELGTDVLLSEANPLILDLDTDNNSSTGYAVGGIGADLEWVFGDRRGTYRYGAGVYSVRWMETGFIALPSVSSNEFEMAFRRDALPDGVHPLFLGPTLRILIRDNGSGGDWIPNSGQTVSYTFGGVSLPPETPVPFAQQSASDMRMITWNTHQDGMWDSGLQPMFRREIQAVNPIICNFQEIYNHTAGQTAALLESWLPSGPGQAWYSASNQDCITVSRFPILHTYQVGNNLGVLLDLSSILQAQLLVINIHLYCCNNDAGRQTEVDNMLYFIRVVMTAGGGVTLAQGTPYIICGDTNFVGLKQQPLSLLTGDIVNNTTYGPDFNPDWDGTNTADLISRQTERRMGYTWRTDASNNYWPGRLDYYIYTDSNLQPKNHFILYPPGMSADSLAAHGLLSTDDAADHLLHCADFAYTGAPLDVWDGTAPGGTDPGRASALRIDWSLGPNPSTGPATITLRPAAASSVRLEAFDPAGRLVARPLAETLVRPAAGGWTVAWDGLDLAGRPLHAGLYLLRLSGRDERGEFSSTRNWTKLP
jgi:hypothetical protein